MAALAMLLLSGCGGGSTTAATPLPASISLSVPARAEPDTSLDLASSLGAAGSGLNFQWEFGDGQVSNAPMPSHRYAAVGRYRVVLRVSNTAGESRRAEAEVLVRRFSFVEQAGCGRPDRTGWCRQTPDAGGAAVDILTTQGDVVAWGGGGDGRLYRTGPQDSTWQPVPTGQASRRILHVGFDAARVVGWALGVAADPAGVPSRGVLLLKTLDGGDTWVRQTLPAGWSPAQVETGALTVLDARHLILRQGGRALVSADGGSSWALIQAEYRAFPRSGTTVWAAVEAAAGVPALLRRSRDLGRSFETVLRLEAGESIQQVEFLDDLRGWVAIVRPAPEVPGGVVDVLLATTDGGTTWQPLAGQGLDRGFLGVTVGGCGAPRFQFVDVARGVATQSCATRFSSSQRAWRTVDGGRSWTLLNFGAFCVGDLNLDIDGSAWTTGRCPSLLPAEPTRRAYLTRDLGLNWTNLEAVQEAETSPVLGVTVAADGAILLRYASRTYRSVDQGRTWQVFKIWPALPPARSAQHAIRFTSAGTGFVVGPEGRLLVTRNGGRQWQAQGLVVKTDQRATGRIDFLGSDSGWILGDRRLYRTVDGGSSWSEVLALDGFFAHFHDFALLGTGRLWATASGLGLFTSLDEGLRWQAPSGSGNLGFQALSIRFGDALRGAAVGLEGGAAFTVDGGQRWQRADAQAGTTLRRVSYADASTAFAVGDAGTVRVSRDAGASWQAVEVDQVFGWNSVYFVDARRGWIVGDFGSIASTRDGGQTWVLQASGTGERLLDVFAVDPETVWIVGERGTVHVSASGGD